ncbi:MAG: hypothetical protein QNJ47_00710 [Nostocaceae cyanobacterium]|nr:hypothetical protein [Nostocaceae cyanobacterium]
MANINVSELKPVGSDLFIDSDSFINELNDDELGQTIGGIPTGTVTWTPVCTNYGCL